MIVLIAPENDVKDEIRILNQLFEVGLERFHLRKPNKDFKQHCAYLDLVDSKYHNRIVVHYHHNLIDSYYLKGIHFQEQQRKDHLDNAINSLKSLQRSRKTVSSSFHHPNDIITCDFNFNYYLLSPVFSSISKQGYEGKAFDVNSINKDIIGMGGASVNNINAFKQLGFKGVGVLGGIWMSTTPVSNFIKMNSSYSNQKE